jgi:hypothetical protein
MMTFLTKLRVAFPGADGAEEPKCHPPAFRDQPRRCHGKGGTGQLYFKLIAPGQTLITRA